MLLPQKFFKATPNSIELDTNSFSKNVVLICALTAMLHNSVIKITILVFISINSG